MLIAVANFAWMVMLLYPEAGTGSQQERVSDGEERDVCAGTEGQEQRRDQRERRCAEEAAKAEPNVLSDRVHQFARKG